MDGQLRLEGGQTEILERDKNRSRATNYSNSADPKQEVRRSLHIGETLDFTREPPQPARDLRRNIEVMLRVAQVVVCRLRVVLLEEQ